MALYIDPDGNEVTVTQKAGRRSLELLGYVLIEADPEDWDVDDEPPIVTPPGAAPEARYTDVLTREDLHGAPPAAPVVNDTAERGDLDGGVVEAEQAPLGVKLDPDPEPTGDPAPWADDVATETAPDAPADDSETAAVDVEPAVTEPEPKPAPAKRTGGRRGSKAASDD
ncbi:hypothetical protein CH275_15940 [Rhodococcus sp. 06-235-1A]|uniref:hypothetical protein n=1 Tax=Rhodococcus sp. 06-235-1A TaxID=2022508 RepID=UPI000B9BAE39|nr:hypothetical protein [Rhodococcus sp. 06-235-1A]OZD03880.1 hypothetical protein CH275_15940 [Rhodococcus sp. 06-235-1A]